ncbi:hypothetical protein QNI23_012440 [Bermanella sp. WJH001]|mgnify:CR=1 FL=1|uniref:hypothetical protein n=1 Tax=Bermanella sp. WJH001 TaxID=3048005 RepID=UPI0024BDBA6C|nr:hypothetical protein [Bermanella sp. WJH001]MDJ1537797.1 hypothetical protein [Bermanella sp. WJH001]
MKLIFIILTILLSSNALSETIEFTREYTYSASENDSKVSARNAAMQQLQSLVIQEVGVQVRSTFTNTETLSGEQFSRDIQANYATFSQALTKTTIIKERWNGQEFFLKANIIVDTESLLKQLQTIYVVSSKPNSEPIDSCKSTYNQVSRLLEEIRTEKVISDLLKISKSHSFERECNGWQYTIIYNFKSALTDNDAYRSHLFESIYNQESDLISSELLIDVLRYALKIKPLSDYEWRITQEAIYRGKKETLSNVIELLYKHTKNSLSATKNIPDIYDRFQTQDQLKAQISDIEMAVYNSEIPYNDPISTLDLHYIFTWRGMLQQPDIAKYYFLENISKFNTKDQNRLAKHVVKRHREFNDYDSDTILMNYIHAVEINKTNSKILFPLLQDMENGKLMRSETYQGFNGFTKANKSKISQILNFARISEHQKNIWTIKYELNSNVACTLSECVKNLFSKNRSEAEKHSEYLIAYGERAKPVENEVIKKLQRIKALNKVSNDTRLIPKLFQILDNIHTTDESAFETMIWAIGDVSSQINQAASNSLIQAGYKAFPTIRKLYSSQKPTPQSRLIEVIGTYKTIQASALEFLTSITPADNNIKFSIEDSIAALKEN